MKVVLIRKLADYMDGVDVTDRQVGDVLDLRPEEAYLLMAEEWVIPDRRREQVWTSGLDRRRTNVAAEAAPTASDTTSGAGEEELPQGRPPVEPTW